MRKKGLVKGALILTGAGVICRLLGVVFRIPFANIVGNYGIGLYQLIFPLYSLLLIVSSAGIPVAISKMIARVRDDQVQCRQIFLNAMFCLLILGAVITTGFFCLAHLLAAGQGKPEIWPLYLAIAPAVFFVCVISAYRGYFQGMANMVPTAVSQVIEQLIKVGVAIPLALWWLHYGVLWAVLGAVLAVTVSEAVAMLVLVIIYRVRVRPVKVAHWFSWPLIKQILVTAAPIMAMSLVFPVVLLFDSFFIVNALQHHGVANATELYGIASGAVHTLINLPTVVGVAIATVMLPMVSRAFKQKEYQTLQKKAWQAVLLTLGFGVLAALILFLLPKLILQILYYRTFAAKPEELATAVLLLRIESVAVVLICLTQVIGSILQGIDRAQWPLIALLGGGITKIVLEIIAIKPWGIMAVSLANVACYAVALIVSLICLFRFLKQRQ